MEHTTLYFRQGSSDKTYQASIEARDGGYVVPFQYGRRGSALQSGTKTRAPVTYDQARKIYDQLLAGKIAKGYSPGEDGTPYQHTDKAVQATGIHCQLLNPVEEDQVERLIADPAWWLSEKLDGRRQLIRKQGPFLNGLGHFMPNAKLEEVTSAPRSFETEFWQRKNSSSPATPGIGRRPWANGDGSTSCDCPGWCKRTALDGSRSCKHTRSVLMGAADRECERRHDYGAAVTAPVTVTLSATRSIAHFG